MVIRQGSRDKHAAAAQPKGRGRAIVAGAGPAGIAAAMYLARQGFEVRVLEKRGDPTAGDAAKTTFMMSLGPRGVEPLRELGVRMPEEGWLNGLVASKGSPVHRIDGSVDLRPHAHGTVFVERALLARHLVQEARRMHPAIIFEFDADIQGYDLHDRAVLVAGTNGSAGTCRHLPYDLLVGADGASSQVRAAVAAQVPGFSVERQYSNREYYIVRDMPPVAGIEPTDGKPSYPGAYLHLFAGKYIAGLPPPNAGVYAHEDGSYSAAVLLPKGCRQPEDAAAWQAELKEALPSMPQEWLGSIAHQTAGQKPRNWGSTIICSQLAVPSAGVALVGDAGHGVTPSMGQGCNAALETVATLSQALDSKQGADIASCLSHFDRVRKPEADALAYLDSIAAHWWFGPIVTAELNGPPYESVADVLSVRVNWPWLGTLANILVSGALHAVLRPLWGEPAMLVGFTLKAMPFTEFARCRRRDTAILLSVLGLVLAAAFAAFVWVVSRATWHCKAAD